MTTATLTYTGNLIATTCWCGIGVGLPSSLYKEMDRNHKQVAYCPVGHSFVIGGESEADKLRRQLKNERDTAERERRWRETAEHRLRATKGVVTKLRKRALDGECPFCGQHLRDLARHVARQHPDESVEVPE